MIISALKRLKVSLRRAQIAGVRAIICDPTCTRQGRRAVYVARCTASGKAGIVVQRPGILLLQTLPKQSRRAVSSKSYLGPHEDDDERNQPEPADDSVELHTVPPALAFCHSPKRAHSLTGSIHVDLVLVQP